MDLASVDKNLKQNKGVELKKSGKTEWNECHKTEYEENLIKSLKKSQKNFIFI